MAITVPVDTFIRDVVLSRKTEGRLVRGRRADPDNPGEDLAYYLEIFSTAIAAKASQRRYRVGKNELARILSDSGFRIRVREDEDDLYLTREPVTNTVKIKNPDLTLVR